MNSRNGWAPLAPLGEVMKQARASVSVQADAAYPNFGIYSYGRGLFHKEPISGASTSATTLYQARAGQFVYSRLFAFEGAYGFVSPDYDKKFVSNEFPLFDCDEERLDAKYLVWLFRRPSTWAEAAKLTSGMGNRRQRIKPEALFTFQIPLPRLAEQRRIVAKIERLAGKIEEAQGLTASARSLSIALEASFLSQQFEGVTTYSPLAEVVAEGSRISYGVLVPGPDVEGGVPFVRVQDLTLDAPAFLPAKRISHEIEATYSRTRLKGGEILLGVVGSIGKVGIAPDGWRGANIARAVCRIVPGPKIDRDYLALFLQSTRAQSYFKDMTRTLAQPTLNVSQLSQLHVPVPSLKEQRHTVAAYHRGRDKLRKVIGYQHHAEVAIGALTPSILDRAFRGEM